MNDFGEDYEGDLIPADPADVADEVPQTFAKESTHLDLDNAVPYEDSFDAEQSAEAAAPSVGEVEEYSEEFDAAENHSAADLLVAVTQGPSAMPGRGIAQSHSIAGDAVIMPKEFVGYAESMRGRDRSSDSSEEEPTAQAPYDVRDKSAGRGTFSGPSTHPVLKQEASYSRSSEPDKSASSTSNDPSLAPANNYPAPVTHHEPLKIPDQQDPKVTSQQGLPLRAKVPPMQTNDSPAHKTLGDEANQPSVMPPPPRQTSRGIDQQPTLQQHTPPSSSEQTAPDSSQQPPLLQPPSQPSSSHPPQPSISVPPPPAWSQSQQYFAPPPHHPSYYPPWPSFEGYPQQSWVHQSYIPPAPPMASHPLFLPPPVWPSPYYHYSSWNPYFPYPSTSPHFPPANYDTSRNHLPGFNTSQPNPSPTSGNLPAQPSEELRSPSDCQFISRKDHLALIKDLLEELRQAKEEAAAAIRAVEEIRSSLLNATSKGTQQKSTAGLSDDPQYARNIKVDVGVSTADLSTELEPESRRQFNSSNTVALTEER